MAGHQSRRADPGHKKPVRSGSAQFREAIAGTHAEQQASLVQLVDWADALEGPAARGVPDAADNFPALPDRVFGARTLLRVERCPVTFLRVGRNARVDNRLPSFTSRRWITIRRPSTAAAWVRFDERWRCLRRRVVVLAGAIALPRDDQPIEEPSPEFTPGPRSRTRPPADLKPDGVILGRRFSGRGSGMSFPSLAGTCRVHGVARPARCARQRSCRSGASLKVWAGSVVGRGSEGNPLRGTS